MLILSRKVNEVIRLDNDIVVKVLSLSENQVKLGIDAPEAVSILRGEVYEKVKAKTLEAALKSKEEIVPEISKLTVNKLKK